MKLWYGYECGHNLGCDGGDNLYAIKIRCDAEREGHDGMSVEDVEREYDWMLKIRVVEVITVGKRTSGSQATSQETS